MNLVIKSSLYSKFCQSLKNLHTINPAMYNTFLATNIKKILKAYSGDLRTIIVQYSNGVKVSDHQMVLFQIKHYLRTNQVFRCDCRATYSVIAHIILDVAQFKEQQQSSQLCSLITGRLCR